MAVRILDEVNLQKIGMSMRNIAALRSVATIIEGAVLETTGIEKLVLGQESADDAFNSGLNRLEELVLSQPSTADEEASKTSVILRLLERIESLEYAMNTVIIRDGTSGKEMTVNDEGRGDVVQHAHPNNGTFQFVQHSISASQDFIIVDISDTTNYPHVNTTYIHLENLGINIDADATADYEIQIGFLENVDATDGDFYGLYHIDGSKKVGQNYDSFLQLYPNGPRMRSESVVSSTISTNDTAFQTDVNLATTLDPSTADTPSGSGDMVVRITMNAGSISLILSGSYHTH
jgi:hypothetical protein